MVHVGNGANAGVAHLAFLAGTENQNRHAVTPMGGALGDIAASHLTVPGFADDTAFSFRGFVDGLITKATRNNDLGSTAGAVPGAIDYGTAGDVDLTVGALVDGNLPFEGTIAEVLVFNDSLNPAENWVVAHYLGSRYGIQMNDDKYEGDTPFRGEFDYDVSGVVSRDGSFITEGTSAGLKITGTTANFPAVSGDYLFFGHRNLNVDTTSAGLGQLTCTERLTREWFLDSQRFATGTAELELEFDLSAMGLPAPPVGTSFVLLSRDSTPPFETTYAPHPVISATQTADTATFVVDLDTVLGYKIITLGIEDTSPPQLVGGVVDGETFECDLAVDWLSEDSMSITGTPVFEDASAFTVDVSTVRVSGSEELCNVEFERTFYVLDECGNDAEYTHTFFVADTTIPNFVRPRTGIEVPCEWIEDPSLYTPEALELYGLEFFGQDRWGLVTNITDNCFVHCDESTPVRNIAEGCLTFDIVYEDISVEPYGECPNQFEVIRRFRVTDPCGNMRQRFQRIRFVDTEGPFFTFANECAVIEPFFLGRGEGPSPFDPEDFVGLPPYEIYCNFLWPCVDCDELFFGDGPTPPGPQTRGDGTEQGVVAELRDGGRQGQQVVQRPDAQFKRPTPADRFAGRGILEEDFPCMFAECFPLPVELDASGMAVLTTDLIGFVDDNCNSDTVTFAFDPPMVSCDDICDFQSAWWEGVFTGETWPLDWWECTSYFGGGYGCYELGLPSWLNSCTNLVEVEVTATDACGNETVRYLCVEVVDPIAPQIVDPFCDAATTITVLCNDDNGYFWNPAVVDNCSTSYLLFLNVVETSPCLYWDELFFSSPSRSSFGPAAFTGDCSWWDGDDVPCMFDDGAAQCYAGSFGDIFFGGVRRDNGPAADFEFLLSNGLSPWWPCQDPWGFGITEDTIVITDGVIPYGPNEGVGVLVWDAYGNIDTCIINIEVTGDLPEPRSVYSTPEEDGFVVESALVPGTGDAATSTSSIIQIGDTKDNLQVKGILSFDTSFIPDNAIIRGATVSLTRVHALPFGDPVNDLGGLVLLEMFDALSGDQALEPSDFESFAQVMMAADPTAPPASFGAAMHFDLNTSAIDRLDRDGTTQFRISFPVPTDNDNSPDGFYFASGEVLNDLANNPRAPRLVVDYYIEECSGCGDQPVNEGGTISQISLRSLGQYDGSLTESDQTSNVGSSANSSSSAIRIGETITGRQQKGMLVFDTSSIPADVEILSAQLRMRMFQWNQDPTSDLGALQVEMRCITQLPTYFGDDEFLGIEDFQAFASLSPVGTFTFPGLFNGAILTADLNEAAITSIVRDGMTQFRLAFEEGDNPAGTDTYILVNGGNVRASLLRPELLLTVREP